MKRIEALFLAVSGLLGSAGPAAPQDIRGVWLTEDGDAHIEIAACGGEELCGRIVWLPDPYDDTGELERDTHNPDPSLRGQTILGLRILRGLSRRPDDGGRWRNGRIYDPKSGRTYRCHLSMKSPDQLKMRGYLGISLLGRTTIWTRVPEAKTTSGGGGTL